MAERTLALAETGLGAASSLETLHMFSRYDSADAAICVGIADAELGDCAHLSRYPGG